MSDPRKPTVPLPGRVSQPSSSAGVRVGRVPVLRTSTAGPVASTSAGPAQPTREEQGSRHDRSNSGGSSSGGTDDGKGVSPTTVMTRRRRPLHVAVDPILGRELTLEETAQRDRQRAELQHGGRGSWTRDPQGSTTPRTVEGLVAGLRAASLGGSGDFTREEDLMTLPAKYKGCKTGTDGQATNLATNYVTIHSKWDTFVVLFDVKFTPDEPVRKLRIQFVEKLLKGCGVVAPEYVYNGRNLAYLRAAAAAVVKNSVEMSFAREGVSAGVKCTLTFARTVTKDDVEINQFLNNMKNHWLANILKLSMLGRAHYDPLAVIKVAEGNTRVHLWPGFETSIADYDGGKLLNVDNRFKVIRDTNMFVIIMDAFNQARRMNRTELEAKHIAAEAVVGSIVITQYSDKPRTYRVVGVDFEKSVDFTFLKDGKMISLKDYFKTKYGYSVREQKQPLLVGEESGAARFKVVGEERKVYLVPEMCNPTGLTDEMRANFRLMKTMAEHTLQQPELRTTKIYDFMGKILGNEMVEQFVQSWDINFASDLMTVVGRLLKPVALQQGHKKFSYQIPRGDWGMDLRSGRFHIPFGNPEGVLFAYPKENGSLAYQFVQELKLVGGPMGWNPPEFERYEYETDRTLLQELRKRLHQGITLVIVMLQAKQKGRYDEIKHELCRVLPVLSQCVVRKTLENSKNLKTVATKIAMQMGCKLGGAPWALDATRLTHKGNVMFVGVDTFHDSGLKGGGRSAVAVVGTLDTVSTEYCSKVFFQAARQEIGDHLACSVAYLMEEYKKTGKGDRYPDIVVFYRDGVGAGQLKAVMDNEVEAIRRAITGKNPHAKMSFVVVTKRHNTRFLVDTGKEMQNPMPGTVVDKGVTKPNRMDFFIVAQSVRQGTVSPTYYNVVYDDTFLTVDQIQQLTYAQCCMYFNWTGPVKVPAQCQYAHKLAFLVGQSIHDAPAEVMSNYLYYL